MHKTRRFAALCGKILLSYLIAWTFGLALGLFTYTLVLLGRIRVRGVGNFVRAIVFGRTLIATNHPSLLAETFLLGALAMPLYLLWPGFALWTMPDTRLLDGWRFPPWFRDVLHCIVVDRRTVITNGRAGIRAAQVLGKGGTLVGYPEEGRTFGAANAHRDPLRRGTREMQDISETKLLLVAARAHSEILSGWIEVPHARKALPLGRCIRRLFTSWDRFEFCFSQPAYRLGESFDLLEENRRLQDLIFDS